MNAYNDLTTFKNRLELATGASLGTTLDTELLKLLVDASRAADRKTNRRFYVESGTYYFRGDGSKLYFSEDVLSITTLKSDVDGDGTFEDSLTEDTDYTLMPQNRFPKTYAEMLPLSSYSGFPSRTRGVEVAGLFGYGNGYRTATPYRSSGATVSVATTTAEAVTASDGSAFSAGQTILAGSEQMYIKSVTDNALTARRGVNGTTAAIQSAVSASIYEYPDDLMEAVLIQAYKWWEEKNVGYQGVMKGGAGEGMVATQRGLSKDFLALCKSYRRNDI